MDKLKLTVRNLGWVFHCILGRTYIGHAIVHITKQPNLKLKTRPKQLLGSLPLAFALPSLAYRILLFSVWCVFTSLVDKSDPCWIDAAFLSHLILTRIDFLHSIHCETKLMIFTHEKYARVWWPWFIFCLYQPTFVTNWLLLTANKSVRTFCR